MHRKFVIPVLMLVFALIVTYIVAARMMDVDIPTVWITGKPRAVPVVRTIARIALPGSQSTIVVRHVDPGIPEDAALIILQADPQGHETTVRTYPGDAKFMGVKVVSRGMAELVVWAEGRRVQDTVEFGF